MALNLREAGYGSAPATDTSGGRKGVFFSFCTEQLCTTGREQSTLEARLVWEQLVHLNRRRGSRTQTQMLMLYYLLKPACPSPISPHHLSLRILSKQDPSLATACCSISSSCGICAPLLPSHHFYPEGLLWSWHHQCQCFLLDIWDSCSNLAVWLRGVLTAGDRNMLIPQLAGIFNPLFLSEAR